ncbi:MAG: ornithine cyclodeaminase family protein [Alphaproteobacteria bacterium]|jgi:alanine dehydrogenase|nr:ornithine cyclodeaminase family protein [Alphaproteobacteria bacterium]
MVSADEIHRLLDYPSLVEGLKAFHLQDTDEASDVHLAQPAPSGNENVFLALPAWQRDQAIGIKLITVFPDNEYTGTGLPSVQGVYALFDGKNGQPLALMDGTALTLRKTAGDSATGASYLAREDAATMLMVGAGAMAPHLIMAHTAIRPSISKVYVWNRSAARAEAVAAELSLDGVVVEAVTDLEAAARQADVISCATMATEPLIQGAWLKPGAHLDLVGSYQKHMRESDDECIRRCRIYMDSRMFALSLPGDLLLPAESGVFTEGDEVGDLFDLARGICHGRQSDEEITFFKNAGGGHLDLGTARFLMSRLEAE